MKSTLRRALRPALRPVLRLALYPWKKSLERQIESTLREAEAQARPGDMPRMKVTGEPPIRLTEAPTPAQVADFVRHRSPTYVGPMSDELADALAGMILDEDRPAPFDTAKMNALLVGSPTAYLAEREGDRCVFDFRKTRLYATRPITIHRYAFDMETGAAEILDAEGRLHREGDPLYERALLHTMCWWSHYIHSGLHNWVHFHLPDCMNEAHTALPDPGSVLARLLSPHVRFTARINVAGLWMNQSTDNGPGLLKRLKPWGAGQSDAEGFRRGVIENTAASYRSLADHLARPERMDLRLPYLRYLHAWLAPIEAFVEAVDPYIEEEAWAAFLEVFERGFPTARSQPRARLLAVFLWQVAVLHVSDHLSYVREAYRYAYHWVPADLDTPFTLEDVRRFDRFKTRNFYNVFVRFNPAPGLKHSLLDVQNYRFDEPPLREAAEAFRASLLEVESRLRAEDNLILRADELLQSVCF